jgi:hypothetical protein
MWNSVNRTTQIIVWIGLVVFSTPLGSSQGLEIGPCSSLSLAKPGYVQSYDGEVRNEDYGFRVTVPRGLEGWGAGPSAPFHGFIIYLDPADSAPSCIDLDVGMPVNLDSEQALAIEQESGSRVRVGNRLGFRRVSHGVIGGKDFENIVVDFHWVSQERSYGLAVTLVSPISKAKQTRPVFERFLSSLIFQ